MLKTILALCLLVFASSCKDTTGPTVNAPVAAVSQTYSKLPFGLFSLPFPTRYQYPFSASQTVAHPKYIMDRINVAKRNGLKLSVVIGNRANVINSNGTFNFEKWKAEVDSLRRAVDINPYINDGTLVAHYLVDEPNCGPCWGGKIIPWQTVEDMAKYSKAIWPQWTTVARVVPSWLAQAPFTYRYLDAAWGQYTLPKGEINSWLTKEVSIAKAEGLGFVAGLNLIDGNKTSNINAPFTVAQVKYFGTLILKNPYVCYSASWEWRDKWWATPGMPEAIDSLRKVADSRPSAPCRVR